MIQGVALGVQQTEGQAPCVALGKPRTSSEPRSPRLGQPSERSRWGQTTCVPTPAPLTSCVAWGELLDLSVPPILHL